MNAPQIRKTDEEISQWLVGALARTLDLEASEIDVQKPFSYYGFGSTETVMIAGDLEDWLGAEFPATLAFDYPNVDSLARHLGQELDGYLV